MMDESPEDAAARRARYTDEEVAASGPELPSEDTITLISADKKRIIVDKNVWQYSTMLKHMKEDFDDNIEVPIKYPGFLVNAIVEYYKWYDTHLKQKEDLKTTQSSTRIGDILIEENEFLERYKEHVFALIDAADFLNMHDLLILLFKKIANDIQGKSVFQIQQMYNIKMSEMLKTQLEHESAWSKSIES